MNEADLLLNNFEIDDLLCAAVHEIDMTVYCIAPLALTPVHGNDCLRNQAISPGETGVVSHFGNLRADRFVCTVKADSDGVMMLQKAKIDWSSVNRPARVARANVNGTAS
jgi:hypothetical protein